jgi:hypothetical protein
MGCLLGRPCKDKHHLQPDDKGVVINTTSNCCNHEPIKVRVEDVDGNLHLKIKEGKASTRVPLLNVRRSQTLNNL